MNRIRLLAAVLVSLATLNGHAAPPEAYPNRPITLVVPFPAGGSGDATARAISAPLAKILGTTVVVDNVGGGSGSIGAAKVARSKPDGYTLLLGTVNETVLAPLVNRAVSYKGEDLQPVGKISESSMILVGRKGIPARNIDELVEYARKNPGSVTYATSGIGSVQHLIMESVQDKSGTSMLHVPYRGGSALVTDLLGGQVDLALVAPATFPEFIENGRVQTFGIASLKRNELLKKVATLNEGKYIKGLDQEAWIGIFAPANTPPEITQALTTALNGLLSDPEFAAQLKRMHLTPGTLAEQAGFARAVAETRLEMRALISKINLNKGEVAR